MPVFRRGTSYLVWPRTNRPGFLFDALTDTASADLDPARLGTAVLREYRPVPDGEPLPPALERLMILTRRSE